MLAHAESGARLEAEGKQGAGRGGVEALTGADDGHAGDGLLLVDAGQLHVGGVVGDVHQGGVDHLVVHGVLGRVAHAAGAGVQVVDEEGAELGLGWRGDR
jgi:hypothetical protein